ncbi:hypothetical protein EYC59_00170 [Candidatus Saccharibacteria bacterium]|nr:MAG: hypothetical protein EYC59_00170 [Candidatus Saccharibacteria bacterium]
MASKELVQRILQQYGVQTRSVGDVQTGYRSESYKLDLYDGRLANLILYKREPGIARRIANANRVGDYLAAQGFPARQTLNPRIIRLQTTRTEQYGALYTYLPGSTIPWEAYTMEHLKQLGGILSDMHITLAALPREELPAVTDEYRALFERMQHYFAQPGVQSAMAAKLKLLPPNLVPHAETINSLSDKPGQALHMDFVRGNVLFQTEPVQLSGILDFEKAAWGPVVFDIARTQAFLLVDCKYKEPRQVWKYFIHSGYNKRGLARYSDWSTLEALIDICLLHDFYKFLLHNPYESLSANEHYVRTTQLLLSRGQLTLHP